MQVQRHRFWWFKGLRGLLLMILGLLILRHPEEALFSLTLYLGIAFCLTGTLQLFLAIAQRKSNFQWHWQLADGSLDIILGTLLLVNPRISVVILPFIFGLWAIFAGILMLAGSFGLKKLDHPNWGIGMVIGLLTIIIGVIVTFHPLAVSLSITVLLAILFLFSGINMIWHSFEFKNQTRHIS